MPRVYVYPVVAQRSVPLHILSLPETSWLVIGCTVLLLPESTEQHDVDSFPFTVGQVAPQSTPLLYSFFVSRCAEHAPLCCASRPAQDGIASALLEDDRPRGISVLSPPFRTRAWAIAAFPFTPPSVSVNPSDPTAVRRRRLESLYPTCRPLGLHSLGRGPSLSFPGDQCLFARH